MCFAESTLIETQDRGTIKISELRKGDYVKTYDESTQKWTYSKFVTYIHADKNVLGHYISVKTSANRILHVSAKHFVAKSSQTDGSIEYVFAKNLKLGDRLIGQSEGKGGFELEEIVELGESYEYGAYAPLTESGTLAVNSLLASCYANTIVPELAHYLFKPIVLLSKFFDYDFASSKNAPINDLNEPLSIESGIFWYARFFYHLVPYIPFSSQLVFF